MSKHYTQSTAALKTVTLDTIKLDAQSIFVYPRTGTRDTRENILNIIDDVKDMANQAANVEYLDARGENVTELDAWGSTISVETNEDGVKIITHNDNWIDLKSTSETNAVPIEIENNKIRFSETEFINVETEKVTTISGYNIFPALTCSKTCKFANLQYVTATSGGNDDGYYLFGKENEYIYSLDLPSLKGLLGAFAQFAQVGSNPKFGLNINVPKLTYMGGAFVKSKIERYHGSTEELLMDSVSFVECNDLIEFNCSLPKLIISMSTFKDCHNLRSFTSSLNSLLFGFNMFENCQLDIESIRKIAHTLPNIKNIDEDVIINLEMFDGDSIVQDQQTISVSDMGQITISWNDLSFPKSEEDTHLLSEDDRAIILYELFPLMERKGWTISTNLTEAAMVNPELDTDYESLEDEIMATSSEEDLETPQSVSKFYKAFKKMFGMSDTQYVDENGEGYDIVESDNVIGPKKSSWIVSTSKEDAANILGLTLAQ